MSKEYEVRTASGVFNVVATCPEAAELELECIGRGTAIEIVERGGSA